MGKGWGVGLGVVVCVAAVLSDSVFDVGTPGLGRGQWLVAIGGILLAALSYLGRPTLLPDLVRRLDARGLGLVSWREVLELSVLFGVVGGILQTAAYAVLVALGWRFDFYRFDAIWLSTIAYVILSIGAGSAAAFLGRTVWSPVGSRPALIFTLAGLVLGSVTLTFRSELGLVASGLLALGTAVLVVRAVRRHATALERGRRPALLGGLAVVLLVGPGAQLVAGARENARLEALPDPADEAVNVLLIILDTVRAQSLSLYAYGRETTPELERVGDRGVVFDAAYSTSSWTLPGHAGIMTGRWPHDLSADRLVPMGERHPTIAEQLGEGGYRTGAFVANSFNAGPHTGLDRGFLHYDAEWTSFRQFLAATSLTRLTLFSRGLGRLARHSDVGTKPASAVSRELERWLAASGDRPFFAFLNYNDAHDPYEPPDPFNRMFQRAVSAGPVNMPSRSRVSVDQTRRSYEQEIAYLDSELGRLIDRLSGAGMLENTLLIITSDHGESFGEHGFFLHANGTYQAEVRIPLIIAGPGVPRGMRVSAPVSARDIGATILALAGEGRPFAGRSLTRFWDGSCSPSAPGEDACPSDEVLLTETSGLLVGQGPLPVQQGNIIGVIRGDHTYSLWGDGREELFDLSVDPWEQDNLVEDPRQRETLDNLRRLLAATGDLEYRDRRNPLWSRARGLGRP